MGEDKKREHSLSEQQKEHVRKNRKSGTMSERGIVDKETLVRQISQVYPMNNFSGLTLLSLCPSKGRHTFFSGRTTKGVGRVNPPDH